MVYNYFLRKYVDFWCVVLMISVESDIYSDILHSEKAATV